MTNFDDFIGNWTCDSLKISIIKFDEKYKFSYNNGYNTTYDLNVKGVSLVFGYSSFYMRDDKLIYSNNGCFTYTLTRDNTIVPKELIGTWKNEPTNSIATISNEEIIFTYAIGKVSKLKFSIHEATKSFIMIGDKKYYGFYKLEGKNLILKYNNLDGSHQTEPETWEKVETETKYRGDWCDIYNNKITIGDGKFIINGVEYEASIYDDNSFYIKNGNLRLCGRFKDNNVLTISFDKISFHQMPSELKKFDQFSVIRRQHGDSAVLHRVNPLIGSWIGRAGLLEITQTQYKIKGPATEIVYKMKFNDDKSYTLGNSANSVCGNFNGTYTLDGDNLSLNCNSKTDTFKRIDPSPNCDLKLLGKWKSNHGVDYEITSDILLAFGFKYKIIFCKDNTFALLGTGSISHRIYYAKYVINEDNLEINYEELNSSDFRFHKETYSRQSTTMFDTKLIGTWQRNAVSAEFLYKITENKIDICGGGGTYILDTNAGELTVRDKECVVYKAKYSFVDDDLHISWNGNYNEICKKVLPEGLIGTWQGNGKKVEITTTKASFAALNQKVDYDAIIQADGIFHFKQAMSSHSYCGKLSVDKDKLRIEYRAADANGNITDRIVAVETYDRVQVKSEPKSDLDPITESLGKGQAIKEVPIKEPRKSIVGNLTNRVTSKGMFSAYISKEFIKIYNSRLEILSPSPRDTAFLGYIGYLVNENVNDIKFKCHGDETKLVVVSDNEIQVVEIPASYKKIYTSSSVDKNSRVSVSDTTILWNHNHNLHILKNGVVTCLTVHRKERITASCIIPIVDSVIPAIDGEIYVAAADNKLHFYKHYGLVYTMPQCSDYACVFLKCDQHGNLLGLFENGEIIVWQNATKNLNDLNCKKFKISVHENQTIDAIDVSPDGKHLAIGVDKSIQIWKTDGTYLKTLNKTLSSLSFSNNNTLLVSGEGFAYVLIVLDEEKKEEKLVNEEKKEEKLVNEEKKEEKEIVSPTKEEKPQIEQAKEITVADSPVVFASDNRIETTEPFAAGLCGRVSLANSMLLTAEQLPTKISPNQSEERNSEMPQLTFTLDGSKMFKILLCTSIISSIAWGGMRWYNQCVFEANYQNYINAAKTAKDPERAAKYADRAVAYLQEKGLTNGRTDFLNDNGPESDIGEFYEDVTIAVKQIKSAPTQEDRQNVTVPKPPNEIALYPANRNFFGWIVANIVVALLSGMGIVKTKKKVESTARRLS